MPADGGDLAFEFAHAGFAGVVVDEALERGGLEPAPAVFEAVLLELALDEVAGGDFELFAVGVTGDCDDLHAVAQGGRHGVPLVGGANEHDLREVEGHVEVGVHEGVVLAGIEHFEQGAGGVAAEIRAHLVHLVEHEHGVARTGAADFLNEAAGHRSDVSAALAANFGLVMDAAQAQAGELPSGRVGDGLAEAGLAHAGRAEEAEDRPVALGVELAQRQILDEAAFDLLEIEMVAVEVEGVLGELAPGQFGQGLDVADDDRILRAGRMEMAQAA